MLAGMYALVTLPVKVRARGHNCADRGRCPVTYPEESFVSGSEILLVALAILVPLAIAIAVTLWTLQPAVLRNERAKRARKRFAQAPPRKVAEEPGSHPE
jgi:hypothetical protein